MKINQCRILRTFAAILIAPSFLLTSCVGGLFGGTTLAMHLETRNGGAIEVDSNQRLSWFFVLARDKQTEEIQVLDGSFDRLAATLNFVAQSPKMTFLLHEGEHSFTSNSSRARSGTYVTEGIEKDRQRISVTWTDQDDLSGISTYIAEEKDITPERYGVTGPSMMSVGITLGLGLMGFFYALGKQLKYPHLAPQERSMLKHIGILLIIGLPCTALLILNASYIASRL